MRENMKLLFLVLGILFLKTVLTYSVYEDKEIDSDEKIFSSSGLKYEIPKDFRLRTPGSLKVRNPHNIRYQ